MQSVWRVFASFSSHSCGCESMVLNMMANVGNQRRAPFARPLWIEGLDRTQRGSFAYWLPNSANFLMRRGYNSLVLFESLVLASASNAEFAATLAETNF